MNSPGDRDPTHPYRTAMNLAAIVGRSPALAETFRRIRSIASVDRLHVLLTGETGSGKSLIARVLHENGPRAAGPFIEVNCAAIPKDLCEAEFFGCAKHAYTQASERPGRFAAAEGGTLFLDEVGEIPLEHQAKLLRVLDEGRYERLGEDRTRSADVRIIAATNRPLHKLVAQGAFRADLYFRLNGYPIRVPSLSERREDLADLSAVLAERECKGLGIPPLVFTEAALHALERRLWPGNVRELRSVVARAVIEAFTAGERTLHARHFTSGESEEPADLELAHDLALGPGGPRFAAATRAFQRRLLTSAMAAENGNVTRAARRLGLSRSHMHGLIRSLRIAGARASAVSFAEPSLTDCFGCTPPSPPSC